MKESLNAQQQLQESIGEATDPKERQKLEKKLIEEKQFSKNIDYQRQQFMGATEEEAAETISGAGGIEAYTAQTKKSARESAVSGKPTRAKAVISTEERGELQEKRIEDRDISKEEANAILQSAGLTAKSLLGHNPTRFRGWLNSNDQFRQEPQAVQAVRFGYVLGFLNPEDIAGSQNIPTLADGGIVNRPTIAMIGEAGPEAVVPLGKKGLGGGDLHVHFYGGVWNEDHLKKKLREALSQHERSQRV